MLQHKEVNDWAVSHVSTAASPESGVRSMRARGPTGSPRRMICIDEARVFLKNNRVQPEDTSVL